MTGLPGQLPNESLAAYKQRFQAQIEAEEQCQLATEAARVQAEEAAAAEQLQLQADADADAQARRKEAQDMLQRHEANSIDRLKFWHFELNGDEATPEEKHKEFLSKLVTRLLYACNYQRSELERQYQDLTQQHQELAKLRRIAVPGPAAGASSSAPSSRQLEDRVDHVVAMLGDISTFAAPTTTISSQLHTLKTEVQQLQTTNPDGNPKMYKMPTFNLERFDDYTQQDLVLWWEAFTTQLRILPVAKHAYIGALFLNSKGGCPTWLSHQATSHGVDVPDLKDKITWEELTWLWKKRFIVDDAPTLAINRLLTMSQGNTATRDWLTEWQKIAAVPNLDLPFTHLIREFYNRSCAALSQALGDREQYSTFAEIIDKVREIIKTNRSAAHEKSPWQPTYVEKVRTGPRQQHFVAVQQDNGDNPATTPASSRKLTASTSSMGQVWLDRGGVQGSRPLRQLLLVQQHQAQDLPMPGSGQGGCATPPQLGKLSSAEGEATPPSTPPDSAALLVASCTSGEDANAASPRYTYEDYAVHLVPPLDQPLHVQQSTACTVSSPSATDSAASPQSIVEDSTSWSRLEELDPLTFTDFQWMPVPSTGRLPKPHCNVLMAQLRDYLHTAVLTPLMDAEAEVVDLHAYIAKIDLEFKTQRYDDIDAPLLYVRIQIGEATCSALIDCGGSRNYISQDFMVRAGLGPRVRRKPQPTQVTLADGHTHKSIDRCIDSVPVYFAPHSSEAVSFDIMDTKFYMILGMSWLRSEDHPVNFFNRTVHIRDRNGVLVPCMVPLPHPSINCHVVSAASMRASIIRDNIEEMGVYFLHALPPHDASSTDSPSDSRITELLDAYSDVFEGPHGVVPDRPIRHEIILEDGAVPPHGCIYRMSEEELSVLHAQLDDLLEKGWIQPSSSPYGAPVFFVRKKNKDLRLCIDYRKLNAQTIGNADPLPRINDLLERLGGAQLFSKRISSQGTTNLRFARRIATRPRSRHATFQAAMITEFRHMLDRFVLIYLNDILVYSQSLDEHVEHLRTVLERLRQAKYKANCDKCEFAQQELEYLGHNVMPQGIPPLADKIEALQSPKVPFVFDDDARRSFQALKTAMLMAPVLSIYDPTLPTRVTTDASAYGIGAVLEPHNDDDWHPVEYLSHKAPPINSLDDARKKELLAFVMALKRWRHFLLGRCRFTWVTYNNPLTYYKTHDTVSSTIKRWMYFIDQFDFTPKHVPCLSNRTTDALSRRPDLCAMTHHAFAFDKELQRHFIRAYQSDPDFGMLYAQLSSDHPPASHYRIVDGYLLLHSRARTYYVSHTTVVFGLASSTSIMIHNSPAISESTALLHGLDSDSVGLTSLPMSLGIATLAKFADAASPATAIPTAKDIVSDRDTRFMSAFWTALMQESGTTMKPSSARHPQTDGQTERAHQTAQMMLRTLIRTDQKDWVDRLPDIEFAYNTSVHPAIGVTPFELHHGGQKGRIFADLLLPRPADINAACSPASVRKYRELLTQARANMQKAQVCMQQQANRRRIPCPICVGDLVWVSAEEFALEQDVSRKLLPKWFGPWSVTAAAGDEPDGPSFVINIPEHRTVHPVFHASKLATTTPAKSDNFSDRRSQDPPMDVHQEVDRVISDRKYESKPRQYKVTFKACDRDDTRWISGADLKASAPLIYAHYEKRRLAQEASRPAPPTRTEVPPSDRQLRPRR
ncbi:hypothetical protein CBR_g56617 [Chara braunii]|uniref:Integrase catalytic domain-containing protein n=1 Tax=Chara braunii TaxID=69332 RepID=A0A388MDU1_CHABU|nr:hypothetical protein CBR_g56617 [Chara braunii]|eukprot:GBG92652.1 hypothetical protein CBR_g56617 [Chara braunii]